MKRLILTAALACVAPAVALAAPLEGLWAIKDSPVQVRFQPCGAVTCGLLETSMRIKADPDALDVHNRDAALRGRRLKGLAMFSDLKPAGEAWKGKVYLAGNGATYGVTLKSTGPDAMTATGCMAPLLCQTSIMTRLP